MTDQLPERPLNPIVRWPASPAVPTPGCPDCAFLARRLEVVTDPDDEDYDQSEAVDLRIRIRRHPDH